MLDKIKELCREQHMSLSELERKAKLKDRTIYKWDESKPSVDKAIAVADVLGVSVVDLIKED